MTMIRTMVRAQVKKLGDDQVEVRMSTATIARDGHILVPQGARLDNYRSNPVFLWNHDVDNFPVGRAESITVQGSQIVALVRFPPVGISARADECRGLVKSGFINGVSVGFDPIEGVPLNPQKPRGGMRVTDWELFECSFCCVPVDPESVVTARAEAYGGGGPVQTSAGLQSATAACARAIEEHRTVSRHHGELGDELGRLDQHRQAAGTALRSLKRALETASDKDPYSVGTVGEHMAGCNRSMDAMARGLKAVGDRHSDLLDAHATMQRALREVSNAYGSGPVQTSAGLTDGESDRARRRRQSESLALAHPPEVQHSADYERRQRQIESLALVHGPD